MNNQPNLDTLLKQHQNVEVVSSKSLYPNSKGTGLDVLKVRTPLCEAHISFQGAQLLYFKPHQGSQFLWLSPNCDFTPGIALRGGIPLCLPWFGPHPTDSSKPKHGFARNREWILEKISELDDGSINLELAFNHREDNFFSQTFSARLTIRLSLELKLELSITNLSDSPMDCSFAFHTYFPVKKLTDTKVLGLKNRIYLDNLEKYAKKYQDEDVSFIGEVDRVFPNIENFVTISEQPNLKIEHRNCPSVIVWNCGPANAQKIADIGIGNDQNYICVERGAVLDESWILAPQESQTSCVKISEVV